MMVVNAANIKKIMIKAGIKKPNKNQIAMIEDYLKGKNITKLDNTAVKEIVKLAQKKGATDLPGVASLADIDKWQAAGSLGLGLGAASMLNKREPSRQEIEDQMTDPYNM